MDWVGSANFASSMTLGKSVWGARLAGAYQRRAARWFGRRLRPVSASAAIVSFSFDDFPRSALLHGGELLSERGFLGTYYAAFGLMKKMEPTGEIFFPEDMDLLLQRGHELGCHTFDHCDSWRTAPKEFEASMVRNQQFLAREWPSIQMQSLSYPISYPRPATKRRVRRHYDCARAGGQTYNWGRGDADYLKSFFLEQSRDDLDVVKRMIDACQCANGWLIFSTHDIAVAPTRYGCSPRFFQQVVQQVVESRVEVLPVYQAWRKIQTQSALPV